MAFPDNNYAPPGVYTQTNFESPVANAITTARIPVLIGEGSEILIQSDLAVVRGSSSTVDQHVVDENEAGRAIVSISAGGAITLGAFDGLLTKLQVRNYPITNGDGTGTTSNSRNAVVVTFNGTPIVVQAVEGLRGIVTLAQAPLSTDVVRVTYYFHRRDTLFTDNVSEQVTADSAVLYGAQGVTPTTGTFTVAAGINDTFVATVLNSAAPSTITVTLPAGNLTASVVANTLTASIPGLTVSTYINNFGLQALALSATTNLLVGNGTANGLLGFAASQTTTRNKVFYTFQGPIVDGSGGGITTTDPSKVVVKINGTQVIPTAVDGSTRAVTLPYAPPVGATVAITYFQNTWQDTFDYLANIGITDITRCAPTPGTNTTGPVYYNEADFVLYNDTIVWGTALLINSSTTAGGSTALGTSQISGSLVDYKYYAAECTAVSLTQFQLPYQPTTGNGRNSPLGSSLFQTVSNGRIDLPTDRPDLVTAYWGYSLQDALDRGAVAVAAVDSATSTITLASEIPSGAKVYASFYYNTLVDKEYLLTVGLPGVGGVGTYTVQDLAGTSTYSATFNPTSKSANLTGITLNFPSGSEYNAGVRFQSSGSSLFSGPLNEVVTIEFANLAATPAALAVWGNDPYFFVENASDNLNIDLDNIGLTQVDLADPNNGTASFGIAAALVGQPVVYDASTGGQSWTLDLTNNVVVLDVDGVQISAKVNTGASKTVADFASAINEAGSGRRGQFAAGSSTTATAATTTIVVDNGTLAAGVSNVSITVPTSAGGSGAPVVLTEGGVWARAGSSILTAASLASAIGAAFPGVLTATNGGTATVTVTTVWKGSESNGATRTCAGGGLTPLGPTLFLGGTEGTAGQAKLGAAASNIDGYYEGWEFVVHSGSATVGKKYTVTAYDGATQTATTSPDWDGGKLPSATNVYFLSNPATWVKVAGSTKFTGNIIVGVGKHDTLSLGYDGNTTGLTGPYTITIANGTYTVSQLAQQIQNQLNADAGLNYGGTVGSEDWSFPQINCIANAEGQIEFWFRRATADTVAGIFSFEGDATPLLDFAVLAGLDASTAFLGNQAAYVSGDFARAYSTTTGAEKLYDRLVVRGRIAPGLGVYDSTLAEYALMAANNVESQSGITVLGGAANDKLGLTVNQTAQACNKATVQPATLRGAFSQSKGQKTATGEFFLTFTTSNNVFNFSVDGTSVSVTFGVGDTPLGDNSVDPGGGTVLGQINTALAAVGTFGNIAAVQASQMCRRDGVGIRLTSRTADVTSSVVIGSGSANGLLGFSTSATAARTSVSASKLVSALLANTGDLFPANTNPSTFAGEAIASVVTADGLEYLYIESNSIGTSSRIDFLAAGSNDALRQGTGLNVTAGTYAEGEAANNGFFVTSSVAGGSGSADTSVLNGGTGQDGTVGQTYVDNVTGLTFTILPRDGGLLYPTGGTFTVTSNTTFVTNGSLPVQIPGVELIVTDTLGTAAGNVATVSTFQRGGQEPAIGDTYYVTYNFDKQDFTPSLYSKVSTIEAVFGALSPDNPVTLAAYLAILNGAVLVGIAQTPKAAGSDFASVATYRDVLDSLSTPMVGNIKPDIIVPLRGDSTEFFQYLSRNVSVQSSIRYQNERTAIIGVSAGTTPSQAQTLAQLMGNTRMRLVYPDTATLTLTDALGNRQEYLIEGPYMAAAVSGNRASPAYDVASPWTNSQLVGFTQLGRKLDAVQQNQTAIRGVTILEDAPPFLKVRHGLTTDMTNILTKLPTIVQIADYVQQNSRIVLANFIGIKFLPGVLSQIEGRLAMMFKSMVAAQIVNAYTGIKANVSPDDPTQAVVEAFFQPVFPLLFIVISFNLRSSLSAQ